MYNRLSNMDFFIQSCKDGDMMKCEEIYIHEGIDIEYKNFFPFTVSCLNGKIDIARWLYEIKEPLFSEEKITMIFISMCHLNNLNTIKLFTELYFNRLTDTQASTIVKYMLCSDISIDKLEWFCTQKKFELHEKIQNYFNFCCINSYFDKAKWLYSLGGINIHADDEYMFRKVCENNNIEMAQWLHSLGDINIHAADEYAFITSCKYYDGTVAKWLYNLGDINIHANNESAFINICAKGNIDMLNWILSIAPDINIRARDDFAFVYACENEYNEIVQILLALCKYYNVVFNDDDQINEYWISTPYNDMITTRKYDDFIENLSLTKDDTIVRECTICYDETKKIYVKSECKHLFCIDCIGEWSFLKNNNGCPYCRQTMVLKDYRIFVE